MCPVRGYGLFNSTPLTNQFPEDGEKMNGCEERTTAAGQSSSSVTAESIALKAASLVGGDRQKTHGDKVRNHENIATLWNAYLAIRRDPAAPLSALDAAHFMVLLKIARTQLGGHNGDDWADMTGYAAVAGEIADRERK